MRMGVTGTRHGWTDEQRGAFLSLLYRHKPTHFAHGDCVGVDDQAVNLVRATLGTACFITCHPPTEESHRAFNKAHDEIEEPLTHFARNRAIVDASSLLVVIPVQEEWQPRGGTWYTHDYAMKKGVRVVVIWPGGNTSDGEVRR